MSSDRDPRSHRPDLPSWIVLKFGGTSVSSVANWRNIARIAGERLATPAHVLIVHSALSGITDRLLKLVDAALGQAHEEELRQIEARHLGLAAELGIAPAPELRVHLDGLRRITDGIARVGEASERTRARVLAAGELMATSIGLPFLAAQGLPVEAVDARTLLTARGPERGAHAASAVLDATCEFAPDPALAQRLATMRPLLITQGFIAGDRDGNTVLLGRGGSDTSSAYLAARLGAERLEIWTDVPGMFSANPRSVPTARLLRALHYDEAQEIATSGAKVLHPRCILPVRQYGIPLHVRATQVPELAGTELGPAVTDGGSQVKAICTRRGITLVSLESPGMWHQVGFLATAFAVFRDQGLSVDMVSTSETNVTVSLDAAANVLDAARLAALEAELGRLCRVQVIGPCASVSLVGRNIRAILHRLGEAFRCFEEQKVYLVSQAANDLNFTFVVDEAQGDRLVAQLHELLIRPTPDDPVLGPSWQELFGAAGPSRPLEVPWWRERRGELLQLARSVEAAYVYDLGTARAAARALRALRSVDRVLYAMKANPHPALLQALDAEGIGFECVSRGELERVLALFPGLPRERILYTPNFALREEYAWAWQAGVRVTIDNAWILAEWPDLLAGRELFLRVDPGIGRGHHSHVRTAGAHAKFGIPLSELDACARRARAAGATLVGLEAHVGSGILDCDSWIDTARTLALAAQRIAGVRVLDIGGGFGVPERPGEAGLDLGRLDALLAAVRAEHPGFELWIEPGRYLVADAGVLLARVTQLKSKGEVRFAGIATGMNSLLRPALYGAWHEIVNLTRLEEPTSELLNIVGPICESADVVGHERLLPPTQAGDVLLIARAGAYGHAMSSHYNLRAPAPEHVLAAAGIAR